MAKTAKFDRQDVVDRATNLYWKKGFHATSMRNLQDEIDLRPGSIYAAFGSKDGLFKEALRNYTDMGLAQLEQLTVEYDSPITVLKAFIKAQVIDSQENAPNGVCMLSKTISELTEENQDLIDITKQHLAEIANEFIVLIKQAQDMSLIKSNKSAEDLASHLQVQIAGLRTFAKVHNDKDKLDAMIEDIFSHYPF
ncbi:TetR/AcrR family transcriptional regulator [Thalassotalea sp. HSM 43]|uniref:TetR/AcrR family transcriptional regulator n=1 Tax=Thalassotalea sp. HSM 43 TaxID=2552945 RepID=UPI0010802BAE|nr:TetR/AcrR family transcriptional regulator [Thalassotalea sp. HSM 43]QBY05668.1 TetR/AcrR family transcriptional regulator [Thalassotalea sp. HSM 43]